MNASLDENSQATITAALNTNGSTIIKVKVNAANHALKVDDNNTGTDHGPSKGLKDENMRTTYFATSSVDGKTPVALYADSSGNLLIQST